MNNSMNVGETFTISGVMRTVPNPDWHWWAFWRPRRIEGPEMQAYRIVAIGTAEAEAIEGLSTIMRCALDAPRTVETIPSGRV